MQKRISYTQFQSVRAVAKAIDPIIRERNKLEAKLRSLISEYKDKKLQIEALEAGIVNVIGFHVEDLVKKVIEPGVDSKGNPTKTTKYLPTDIVTYDEATKQYVITIPDDTEDTTNAQPVEEKEVAATQTEEQTTETSLPEEVFPFEQTEEESTF